jgi:hypothetical protein
MGKVEIVPFGKYKGQPIEVLAQDREYCEWLIAQDWLPARYAAIHTLIVNNFGEPSETPEHNALQAMFTRTDFCERFALRLAGGMGKMRERFDAARQDQLAGDAKQVSTTQAFLAQSAEHLTSLQQDLALKNANPNPTFPWEKKYAAERVTAEEEKIAGYNSRIAFHTCRIEQVTAQAEMPALAFTSDAKFEVSGADVVFVYGIRAYIEGVEFREGGRFFYRLDSDRVHVECKPSVADDYPAVLRQITSIRDNLERSSRTNRSVLLVGKGGYIGVGATFEQVKNIFASRDIEIVLLKDLA